MLHIMKRGATPQTNIAKPCAAARQSCHTHKKFPNFKIIEDTFIN